MLWSRYLPTQASRAAASDAADATDRKVHALESHQARVLEALDRELELYRLTNPRKEPRL